MKERAVAPGGGCKPCGGVTWVPIPLQLVQREIRRHGRKPAKPAEALRVLGCLTGVEISRRGMCDRPSRGVWQE